MVVAIDGPAGAGKSTVARLVSQTFGFAYLNSGNLYRALAHQAIERGIAFDSDAIVDLAAKTGLDVDGDRVTCNGVDVSSELHGDAVDAQVARISAIPKLREVVNAHLRRLSAGRDVVVEGRDMTTLVFPDAELKFYLDASIESRAHRRYEQGTSRKSEHELQVSIRERDSIDKSKPVGRLSIAPDAQYLDSTDLTIEEVCATVVRSIQGHILRQENG